MHAQISLEYLIVLGLSVSVLVVFLPGLSRVRSVSERAVSGSQVDSVVRSLSSGCEEVLVLGPDSSVEVDVPLDVDISEEEGVLMVSGGGVNLSLNWSDYCVVERDFQSNGSILISHGV